MSDTIQAEKPRVLTSILIPGIMLMMMWAIKAAEALWSIDLAPYGLYPRAWKGLPGILTSPFLHGDWSHLGANSASLFVLTAALFYFYRQIALQVFLWNWLMTGLWVWMGAREAYHIGASGLVYGLASFLFFSGLVRRDTKLSALALFVVFAYGGLVWGIFPQFFPTRNISWESHLAGLIAGIVLAIYFRRKGPREPRYSWEFEEEEGEELMEGGEHIPPEPGPPVKPEEKQVEVRYHYKKAADT